MVFIETPIFTRTIDELLEDDEYRALQLTLLLRPGAGKMIPRSGGLRKFRWAMEGRGKRSGCRIIYYWDEPSETCYMLFAFAKNDREDLTARQVKLLRLLVSEEFG